MMANTDAEFDNEAHAAWWTDERGPGFGWLPETLLVTDDMQMQGLQKALGTREARLQSLQAGMDML